MDRNQVLKQRSITGIIFGIVVLTLLNGGLYGQLLLLAIVAFGCCYEYIKMVFPANNHTQLTIGLASTAFGICTAYVASHNEAQTNILLLICCALHIIGIITLFTSRFSDTKWYALVCYGFFGLPIGTMATYLYHAPSTMLSFLLCLIILIWVSDTFAYLFGSRIGKHKLMERVSPKKTWEGFIGGGIGVIIFAIIIDFLSDIPFAVFVWIVIGLIVWIFGTFGDLVESHIKRLHHVKDSGKLLPGHGGIYDRFDSFIYILPFVLLLLSLI